MTAQMHGQHLHAELCLAWHYSSQLPWPASDGIPLPHAWHAVSASSHSCTPATQPQHEPFSCTAAQSLYQAEPLQNFVMQALASRRQLLVMQAEYLAECQDRMESANGGRVCLDPFEGMAGSSQCHLMTDWQRNLHASSPVDAPAAGDELLHLSCMG